MPKYNFGEFIDFLPKGGIGSWAKKDVCLF
jgi:hypothetical protein